MAGIWSLLLDLLFPPKCPSCKAAVFEHGAWCDPCFRRIYWPRLINTTGRRLKALDACRVLVRYEGKVQRLIRDLKFRGQKNHSQYLTWLLFKASECNLNYQVDAVVPIPLSAKRLKERGFNQVETVFDPWVESMGFRWLDVLARQKDTLPQWQLGLAERRKNIKGAFVVTRPELVENKRILLVDDIFTSGITMNECAAALKQAGAVKVFGLALAGEGLD